MAAQPLQLCALSLPACVHARVLLQGMALEFKPAETAHAADAAAAAGAATAEPAAGAASYLTLINGLWGLLLAFGMLLTSLKVLRARRWLLGRAWLRGGLADYGELPNAATLVAGCARAVHNDARCCHLCLQACR